MEYRIVKTELRGDTRYHIEKKWLLWWLIASARSFYTLKGVIGFSDAILTRTAFQFSTEEGCREHLQKYFISPITTVYKNNIIQRRFGTDYKDYYVNLSKSTGKYANSNTYEYSIDLDYLKERINRRLEKPKQTTIAI